MKLFGVLLCLIVLAQSARIERQNVAQNQVQYKESDEVDQEDAPDEVPENCPAISEVASRRQSIFKHLIQRWRKNIESQQPWEAWSRKIIKCSLGKQIYRALGPESKIHMTENIRAILKRELKIRQREMAATESKKNPCHPFLGERGKLKAILKFRASMVLARKPVVYLYPETPTTVNVSVDLKDGEFTTVYPKFNSRRQWEVRALPTGKLIDVATQRPYNYLFWEASRANGFSVQDGACVKRENTEAFLEKALSAVGLNDQERNDFMVYWLPELEKNPFNLISFSTNEYNAWSSLNISPSPKTLIRVFMTYSPLESEITATGFSLPTVAPRSGFTVVEWGGAMVPRF